MNKFRFRESKKNMAVYQGVDKKGLAYIAFE